MKTFFSDHKRFGISAVMIASIGFAFTMAFSDEYCHPIQAFSEASVKLKEPPPDQVLGSLSGIVLIDGKEPMPYGTVIAYGAHNISPVTCGYIKSTGGYSLRDLVIGPVYLVVTPRLLRLSGDGRLLPVEEIRQTRYLKSKVAKVEPTVATYRAKSIRQIQATRPRPEGSVLDPSLYTKIDRLYGSLSAPQRISTIISEGENTFDVVLAIASNK